MIDLYYWPTPNGHKVTIFLEETGLEYRIVPINIRKGEQFAPEFLKISPNNRMPAIVDTDGPGGKPFSLFESGAILLYLAEKTGKLMPSETRARYRAIEWLMFQMANVGPMLGQAGHFRNAAPEKIPYAIERYTNESRRLFNVLDRRLAEVPFVAGEYSIADIATYPWVVAALKAQPEQLGTRPDLKRWIDALAARPAVQKGMAVMADQPQKPLTEEERSILYGSKQHERR
ncbi:MAG TPA: glutathione S-transferase N-terminal domain-containing protein [Candidatus Binataceae bacterium]|jgi:GST-like protein|nr:glutathione S-transferase N-terminal domain-containing protein [Candidatus Binataceae bacterium]